MEPKTELMKKLKEQYYNDYAVLYSHYNDFKYWIFGTYEHAKKHYERVMNSMLMDNMPCSLQIHLLN
jgi:hypothetical protein